MKYILIIFALICLLFSGCKTEYVYIQPSYNYDSCTYTDMYFIKKYVNNKEKYKSFDHYMQVNYKVNFNRNIK